MPPIKEDALGEDEENQQVFLSQFLFWNLRNRIGDKQIIKHQGNVLVNCPDNFTTLLIVSTLIDWF